MTDGEPVATPQVSGRRVPGRGRLPAAVGGPVPRRARSPTWPRCSTPDAPTPSGVPALVPVHIGGLPSGHRAALNPPKGAVKHRNDGGTDEYRAPHRPRGTARTATSSA
ncbi:hypothetical protein QJS66_10585 [Kocuria rhizophila]|nr:hypothetical protein QJS66_10585 [Kocuria rhizophila]